MFKLEPQSSITGNASSAVARVAVLIVSYNGRDDVCQCLESVFACQDESVDCRVTVVDNHSTDGTVEAVRRRYPGVEVIVSDENLAFAGGNNLGWQSIARRWPEVEFLFLLNQDTEVTDGWLQAAVDTLRAHPRAACARPRFCCTTNPSGSTRPATCRTSSALGLRPATGR